MKEKVKVLLNVSSVQDLVGLLVNLPSLTSGKNFYEAENSADTLRNRCILIKKK